MAGIGSAPGIGTIIGGIQQKQSADAEAHSLKLQGIQDVAASQRPAEIALKQGELVASRQRAVSAASGAGATDPTVQNIEADTGRNAEYNALTALYEGKSAAASLDYQARMDRYAGTQALIGSIYKGVAQIASAAVGMPGIGGGGAGSAGLTGMTGKSTIGSGGQSFFDQYGLPFDQWNIGG